MSETSTNVGRRSFFRAVARWGTLSGMAAAGAVMVARQPQPSQNQTCVNRSRCGPCPALPSCALPQGLMTRQAQMPPGIPATLGTPEISATPGTRS